MTAVVEFVVVGYFASSDVARLVDSLERQDDRRWQLVVVDNSESDEEHRALLTAVGAAGRVVRPPGNLGYLGGARYALAEDRPRSPWTCVSNADLDFAPDFVRRCAELTVPAVTGPAIVSGMSGTDQNPFMERQPTSAQTLRWVCQSHFVPLARAVVALDHLLAWLLGRLRLRPRRHRIGPAREIYAAHGSCLVLPREYFARGAGLEHEPFLFGEEVTVAEAARSVGLGVRYDPGLRVRHAEHSSTGSWRSRRVLLAQREAARYVRRLLA